MHIDIHHILDIIYVYICSKNTHRFHMNTVDSRTLPVSPLGSSQAEAPDEAEKSVRSLKAVAGKPEEFSLDFLVEEAKLLENHS